MMHSNVAHVMCSDVLEDGTRYAITMRNRGEHGVLVWAGRLAPSAHGKSADQIERSDYQVRETVSFMSWLSARDYFMTRPFSHLLVELIAVHKRNAIAGGRNPGT